MDEQTTMFDMATLKAEVKDYQRQIEQMRFMAERLNATIKPGNRPTVHSPRDAFDLLWNFSTYEEEHLIVIPLNTRNGVIRIIDLYKGSINSSQVRVAEVFRPVILLSALAFILAHNHPSGDPTPSPEDISITRAIVQAGKLLDIDCLDHIIVGSSAFVSLKERGLGFS